jgi:hypothetical protein
MGLLLRMGYKVEVHGVMLLETTLIFPNLKDDLPQLLLKVVIGQFTLWEGANLRKSS